MTDVNEQTLIELDASDEVKHAAGNTLDDAAFLKGLKDPYSAEDIRRTIFKDMLNDISLVGHYLGFRTVRGPDPKEDRKSYTWQPSAKYGELVRNAQWLMRSGNGRKLEDDEPTFSRFFLNVSYEYYDDPALAGTNFRYVPSGEEFALGPSLLKGPAFTPYTDKDNDPRWGLRTQISMGSVRLNVISREVENSVTSAPVRESLFTVKLNNRLGTDTITSSASRTYTTQSSYDIASNLRFSNSFSWQLGASENVNFGAPEAMFARFSLTLSESVSGTTSTDKSYSKSEVKSSSRSVTETFNFSCPAHTIRDFEVFATKTTTTATFRARVFLSFAVVFEGPLRYAFEERFKGDGNYHLSASGHQSDDIYTYRLGNDSKTWWEELKENFNNNTGDFDLEKCAENNPEFKSLLDKIFSDDYQKLAEFTVGGALGYAERTGVDYEIKNNDVSME